MEVTKDNYSKAFGLLQSSIDKADFIAIDGEFTGLSKLRFPRVTYDTLEEKFYKLRAGSREFLFIQYGICLFTWNEESELYEAMPFTFYIYPRPYKRTYNDVMFMCQSSSLDFLAKNGFDFNKLIYKGVSFLSPWQECKARERFEKDLSYCAASASETSDLLSTSQNEVFIPQKHREFIDSIVKSIEEFLKGDEKTHNLPSCNAFQRKLIYEVLQQKYPLGLYLESVEIENSPLKFIRAIKVTQSGLSELKNESYRKEVEDFEEILGFTNVMKLLSEAKKPIIGHNMLMDLFLTVFNFFDCTITKYEDFKMLVNSLFPLIYDTKVMASNQPILNEIAGTGLGSLYGQVQDGCLPDPKVSTSSKLDDVEKMENQFHQAGFDAYCTGYIFISFYKYLCSSINVTSNRIDLNHKIMLPYQNKVFIMGILDIFYTNIGGEDPQPSRKDVFHITHPKGYGDKDFDNIFSPICSLRRPTAWLNDMSAFVTIDDIEKFEEVKETLVLNNEYQHLFKISPYEWPEKKILCIKITETSDKDINFEKVDRKRKREKNSDKEDGEILSDDDDDEGEEKICPLKKKSSELFDVAKEW